METPFLIATFLSVFILNPQPWLRNFLPSYTLFFYPTILLLPVQLFFYCQFLRPFSIDTFRLSSYSSIIQSIHRNFFRFHLHLLWVLAHSAISGNEAADDVNKTEASSSIPIYDLPLSLSELRSQFSSFI